jgi:hypothetical protein
MSQSASSLLSTGTPVVFTLDPRQKTTIAYDTLNRALREAKTHMTQKNKTTHIIIVKT